MSHRHASDDASIKLVLIGVAEICVADILCR
jgi:hypothetical protein